MNNGLQFSRRIRRTPYTDRVEKAGVSGYTVTNHMLLPKAYRHSVEDDYWHLCEHVQIWDVSCQRQVQITGPDAEKLVQWMTPRNIAGATVGDCLYIPIVDEKGGLINDPILLKISEDCFWLSIADSDVLLYASGLAIGSNLNVQIDEPDISPLAIQGPKSEDLMAKVFGEEIRHIGFFKHKWFEFLNKPQAISRTGYSRQDGFEIYLEGSELGWLLWDTLMDAGQKFNIRPGSPNLIDRIEGGLLSYGNEMTRQNNPLELGFDGFCTLDGTIEFIGLQALQKVATEGVKRQIRGVIFDGCKVPACSYPWPVYADNIQIGQVTSAIWSPRFKANIGLSLIDREFWHAGQRIEVRINQESPRKGEITDLPMPDRTD